MPAEGDRSSELPALGLARLLVLAAVLLSFPTRVCLESKPDRLAPPYSAPIGEPLWLSLHPLQKTSGHQQEQFSCGSPTLQVNVSLRCIGQQIFATDMDFQFSF